MRSTGAADDEGGDVADRVIDHEEQDSRGFEPLDVHAIDFDSRVASLEAGAGSGSVAEVVTTIERMYVPEAAELLEV